MHNHLSVNKFYEAKDYTCNKYVSMNYVLKSRLFSEIYNDYITIFSINVIQI